MKTKFFSMMIIFLGLTLIASYSYCSNLYSENTPVIRIAQADEANKPEQAAEESKKGEGEAVIEIIEEEPVTEIDEGTKNETADEYGVPEVDPNSEETEVVPPEENSQTQSTTEPSETNEENNQPKE